MTLYEIDDRILDLLTQLEPNLETGEIPSNYEELDKQLQNLEMQRFEKLQGVARYVLNTRVEALMLKAEESRLSERRKMLEKREASLISYLDHACMGQKTDLGIATVCYRKSDKVAVTDYHQAIQYLAEHHHSDCIRTIEPEISKAEVKALIKSGEEVPGIEIVQGVSCTVR